MTILDMRAVTFFGVAGVRALIAARGFADRPHCAMHIEGPYCVGNTRPHQLICGGDW
ncbi:hypothetical protein GCM10027262_76300 [Nocardia tengchongensis]